MNKTAIFEGMSPTLMYVAFVDILGFSSMVRQDYNEVLEIYKRMLNTTEILKGMQEDVSFRVYSDAFMLTSSNLASLIGIVHGLHMQTLFNDCLIRGGIGFGEHIESSDRNNLFIVSKALVNAVQVEKTIKYPCVSFHQEIVIPDEWWRQDIHPIDRQLLYFDDIVLINPFNRYWFDSARTRVALSESEKPDHKIKKEWFLRLHQSVADATNLVPDLIKNKKH